MTFPAIYLASDNLHPAGNVMLALWLAHYVHRSLVWCWLVPRRGTTVPVPICTASIGFNVVNGVLLGWFMGYTADYPDQWLTDPRFIVGLGLFIAGSWRTVGLLSVAQGVFTASARPPGRSSIAC